MSHQKKILLAILAIVPWAVAVLLATPTTAIWIILGGFACLVAIYFVLRTSNPDPLKAKTLPVLMNEEREAAQAEAIELEIRTRYQAQTHLNRSIDSLAAARQDAEIAVLKVCENVARLSGLQTKQFAWIAEQLSPKLSRAGSVPDSAKLINAQMQSEIKRLVVNLQFHDVLDQQLQKVRDTQIACAIAALGTPLVEPQSNRQQTPAAVIIQARTTKLSPLEGAVTPIKRGEVELF